MEKKTILNIISQNFPYGLGEQFFEVEVLELAKYYDKIVLFPLEKLDGIRSLPPNVTVNDALCEVVRKSSVRDIVFSIGLSFRIVWYELRNSNKKFFIIRKLKWWLTLVAYSKKLRTAYLSQINQNETNSHYSFWMNEGALTLSVLKLKGDIVKFDFRVNGFDIFEERHAGSYMPFRYFNYNQVDNVFVLSKVALTYLKSINFRTEKLIYAPYGIYAKGINKYNSSAEVKIVSCANMIPLKRIDKIIDALKLINDKPIHWIHFGDGLLRKELEEQLKDLSPNISVDFKGHLPNSEIIELYQNHTVNLFIHTSETEGLGMAIIEAQSFGIPAVVIGVGGVLDIVTEQTGIVLKPEAGGVEIADAILSVINGEMNTQEYRSVIQSHCFSKFDGEKNYQLLYQKLIKS